MKKILIGSVISVSLILLLTSPALGKLQGIWESKLYMTKEKVLGNFDSSLSLSYQKEGLELKSKSLIQDSNFESELIEFNFPLGISKVESEAAFDVQSSHLSYWKTTASAYMAGLHLSSCFILEKLGRSKEYGWGSELGLATRLGEDYLLSTAFLFGLEENEAEKLGIVPGSGYSLTQTKNIGSSNAPFTSAKIELTDLKENCFDVDVLTSFDIQSGFEEISFDYTLRSQDFPLQLDAETTFTSQSKSVSLRPILNLGWSCFEVYTDLQLSESYRLNSFEIEGLGVFDVGPDPFGFSSLTSLTGNLYHLPNQENIDLHAGDYLVAPRRILTGCISCSYVEEPYDELISLHWAGNPDCWVDSYFKMGRSEHIFDLSLITFKADFEATKNLNYETGLVMKPDGLKNLRFGVKYWF